MKNRLAPSISTIGLLAALVIPLAAQHTRYKLIDLGTLGGANSGTAGFSVLAPAMSAAQSAPAYKVLYAFTGGADGGQPMAGLIRDNAGNLYGTTQGGGILSGPCAPSGCGVVFKLDSSGKETVLYRFTGGEDGASPAASLVRDSAGNLYSSTGSGGRSCIWSGNGCGVIFKLDPATGKETVLHAFTGGADGWSPAGSLLLDEAGTLYGVTASGGASGGCGGGGCGVVFKLDTATREETVLYTFTGGADGGQPVAGLLRDSAGNFYGTASLGGIPEPCGIGCGVTFELESTDIESVLYTFRDGADGGVPVAALIKDSVGNFYGTTEYGGTSDWGVVFKLSPSGVETVLHTFTGGADGATPRGGLIQDAASNRYGTALQGGTGTFFTNGVVFKLNSAGAFSVLHTFAANGTEGANPEAGLLIDPSGNLYGTASTGGAGFGVVFELLAAASVPIVTLSPTGLTFPTQAIGTTSRGKMVALKNTGTASLTITSLSIVGTNAADFAQTHTCGSSLAAGATCSVSVTFKPTASGTRRATLSISDNAAGSPQRVSLSGIGTTAKLSPSSLTFGSVTIGDSSALQTVTLTNVGTTSLNITGIAITGSDPVDFAQTHTCGSSLAASASCSISVTFKPTASGTRTAALSVNDSGGGSPQIVPLSGTGVAGFCSRYGQECGAPQLPHCCSGLTCSYCGLRDCCL